MDEGDNVTDHADRGGLVALPLPVKKMVDYLLNMKYLLYVTLKKTFTHGDVLKLFPAIPGISLIKWVERGLINPLYDPHTSGGKRLYSYVNLIQIGFIHELAALGVPTPWIKHEVLAEPRVSWVFDNEAFEGTFFQYWRVPRTLPEGQYEDERVKDHCRQFMGGLYVGQDKTQLSLEGAISYLVVNLDQLRKEIDLRLVQEGWK